MAPNHSSSPPWTPHHAGCFLHRESVEGSGRTGSSPFLPFSWFTDSGKGSASSGSTTSPTCSPKHEGFSPKKSASQVSPGLYSFFFSFPLSVQPSFPSFFLPQDSFTLQSRLAWGYMSVPSCQCVTPGLHTGFQDHNKGIFHQDELGWRSTEPPTHSQLPSSLLVSFIHWLVHSYPFTLLSCTQCSCGNTEPPLLTPSQGPLFLTVLPESGLDCTIKSWPPAWWEVLEREREMGRTHV